ncbi:hypothetical protein M409DRAFT_24334 [Zasmidium cellare ATCC 36951]|uniref:Uncharacterized protein n=1 Tax=Zasmidium cellare ATCC 36951 TaxID=1080233 RepID=A0A6A6CFR0_ZASCE|nr:uncharacterized protein M409DRAFT_24334 [Zasmidium cellare ATCC 36951]KAF2165483.1 hypothetical protein M409DRAFT_24334 [Zasmidium cellare ATCC 36951]
MANHINDHWLWLGIGLFFLAAAKGIQYAINDIATLTELDPIDGKPQDSDRPEDSISISTFRSLSAHPNPSIASAAQSLIVTRFAASPNAADLITSDLTSSDVEIQRKAKQAIVYLQEWDAELNGADTLLEEYDTAREEAERLLTGTGHLRARRSSGEQSPLFGPEMETVRPVTTLEDLASTREGALDAPRFAMESARRALRGVDDDDDDTPERFGEARFAGWERIPTQRPVVGEREDERRRRRREAMVVSEGDAGGMFE